jgi:hypothetical protein
MEEEPPAELHTAREEKSDDKQAKLDDALSKVGCSLTIGDITEGLGVSVGAAQALIAAGLRGNQADEK